ncbi:NAD-dependent epimerase/dehydratase family protein, partial [Streptococcus suis]
SESYAHLFRLPQTGLRFFTVYGPWGRPDMMLWIFTGKILRGEPIPVFNHGRMERDFTFIDDNKDKWGLGFLITTNQVAGKRSPGSLSWGGINN